MDPISRRDWLKTLGAAGAGALLPEATILHPGTAILPLTSTTDVFAANRGRRKEERDEESQVQPTRARPRDVFESAHRFPRTFYGFPGSGALAAAA